ncbi:hypothetical protein H8356DRAFT_1728222, partial [Neocallimastix lanati (nom. inval.)]
MFKKTFFFVCLLACFCILFSLIKWIFKSYTHIYINFLIFFSILKSMPLLKISLILKFNYYEQY